MVGDAIMLSRPERFMNSRILWRWGLGVGVAALLFGGGIPQRASGQATNSPPPALEPKANTEALAPATASEEASLGEQADEVALAEASVKPISTGKALPPSIKLTGPVSEVVKLAESGVDESVMMAFVTNSMSLFNLGVEEIIYLNDIGVPGPVVTAMMQRDEVLKGLPGSAAPLPAASEPDNPAIYAPQPAATAAPPEIAPEGPPPGDNAMVDYSPPPAADTGYSTFYDSLAPYGTWVDVAGYGPCWQPTVVVANPTWRPYCDGGRWVDSDCGWYWMSGYSWGWAPFHYGRWFRHNRMGWCWAPDTVWGPSWVCWRYGGSHCGWAPLPPGAWYRPGVGLTFHGRHVGGSFGFGLGANAFAFVEVNHFRNAHLNRHALPPQQATEVFNRTRGSTTIVENGRRVINHGIPVSRVAEATGTEVHRIAIRDANTTARQGPRSERFEGDSRSLTVYRPHFSPPSGAQPSSGARPRSELRNGGSIPAAASTTHGVIREPLTRAGGGSAAAQPGGTGHFVTRAGRPATGVEGTATTGTGSTRTIGTVRSDPAPRSAAPLIQHGSDRPGQGTASSRTGTARETLPPKAVVATGSREATQQRMVQPSSPWAAATPHSQPTARSQDSFSRPVVNQRPQSPTSAAWAPPTRSEPARSAPRATAPPVRSEPPRQYAAPSYQAPAERRWSAPAPALAPQPRPSFSAPPVSSTPRMQPMESRPAYSAPSAPAASVPASRPQPSSGRNGR